MEKNKDVAGTSSCPGEIYFADSARGRIVFAEGKGKNRNDPQFPMESEKGKWKGMSKGGLTTTRHDYSPSLFPFFFFFSRKKTQKVFHSYIYIYIYVYELSPVWALSARVPTADVIYRREKERKWERERERSIIRFQTRREELILPDIDKNVMFSLFGT